MSAARTRNAYILLWVIPALWSSNYIIARLATGVITPHMLALGRWALAFALMLPFVGRELLGSGAWRREGVQWIVLGALGMWICGALLYVAAASTSTANMALIYAAAPVAIAVASAKLLQERMSNAQRIGVVFALVGVLFVVAKGDLRNLLAVRLSRGDGWVVVAALSWVAYSVLLRRWPSVLSPAARLAAIIGAGVLFLLPFTLLEAVIQPRLPYSHAALGLVVLAAVLPGVLSYTAYSFLQRELGASRTALMLYLAPIYSAVIAWIFLDEVPQAYHALGAALILPSIWLATRMRSPGAPPPGR